MGISISIHATHMHIYRTIVQSIANQTMYCFLELPSKNWLRDIGELQSSGISFQDILIIISYI